jgi:PPE-repeat protein
MTTIYSVMYPTQTPTGTATNQSPSTQQATSGSQLLSRNVALSSAYSPSANDTKSWYEAMAKAWGQALNQQAQVITQLSDQVSNAGQDQPSQVTQLTAESMRFSYLATNASTATTSVGEALQTLGRKQ